MPDGQESALARGIRVSWPHFVLLVVYLFYLGIGGGIFLAIEGGNQPDYAVEIAWYEALKAQLDSAVKNISEGQHVTVGNLTGVWEEYKALVEVAYTEDLMHLSRIDWTYTGSVLFCATSIATIGYGDAVPVTTWGRVVLVIYSLIGIPLTLTFLADIGGLLARLVVLISAKCRCRRGVKGSPRTATKSQVRDNANSTEQLHHPNGRSIPSGEVAVRAREPARDGGNIMEMRLALGVFVDTADPVRGSQPNSRRNSADVEMAQPDRADLDILPGSTDFFSGRANLGYAADNPGHEEEKKFPKCPVANTTGEEAADVTDSMQRHVPVIVVVLILIVYTFLGALMIAYVEEWYYGEALYFTFVTLTTIGFGDFVPVKHYMDIPSFFGCLAYTIVGLSVMSMCIALVQAKVVGLVSKVARKIGF